MGELQEFTHILRRIANRMKSRASKTHSPGVHLRSAEVRGIGIALRRPRAFDANTPCDAVAQTHHRGLVFDLAGRDIQEARCERFVAGWRQVRAGSLSVSWILPMLR